MEQYDKIVLNKLLDTYESSLLSMGKNERTIHIEMRFIKKNIPAYFDERSDEYEKIHAFMKQLEQKSLIQIIWAGNKVNHIIAKVRLNVESLQSAYQYVNRTAKSDLVSDNMEMLEEYLEKADTPVAKCFIEYLLKSLQKNKSVKEFIKLENLADTKKVLESIQAIERNTKQLYTREFSIAIFHDTKTFEKMQGRIKHVFCSFKPGCEGYKLSEILAEYNIYQNPNFVYIKGRAVIYIGNEKIELSALKQGIGISGEDINQISILDVHNIKRVITIENLTTYYRWQEESSLIIYLGGYHNSVRRNLLKNVYAKVPNAKYYHFGDIDAGGFEIYRDLCDKTGIPFKMLYMDLNTLKQYKMFGKKLTQNDKKRLVGMQDREELKEVVTYMLKHNVKLEQECIGGEMKHFL